MDQGINLPFSSVGIDDAAFGMPTFADGWKGLIITGSSQKALNHNKGGRLLLHVKCGMDPTGADVGKEHIISLNLWHNDQATKDRAAAELASIIRAIFGGDRQINSTAELYNQPFLAKAVTQTPAATPEYPNPMPQTNWRGYATKDGLGVGNIEGPNGKLGAGANGGGASAGGPPNFNQNQPNPPANNGNQGGGWGNNSPQPQQQNQPNPQQQNGGGWNGNGNNGPAPQNNQQNGGGWGPGGSNAPNLQQGNGAGAPNNAQQNGGQGGWNGGGAQTQSPFNNGPANNGGGDPNAPWGNNANNGGGNGGGWG